MWLKHPKNIDKYYRKKPISPTMGAYALLYQYIDGNI